MNGPQHYREAERLLTLSAELPPGAAKDIGAITVAQAQVHATLADAAATIDSLPPSEQAVNNAWKSVTS